MEIRIIAGVVFATVQRSPLLITHTAKGTADQEPWVHGPKHEAIRRKYIELRYELMPYLYTGIEEASRTGIPLMRPVFLDYRKRRNFTETTATSFSEEISLSRQ